MGVVWDPTNTLDRNSGLIWVHGSFISVEGML